MKAMILSSVLLASSASATKPVACADARAAPRGEADMPAEAQLRALERDEAAARAEVQAAFARKLHARAKWDAAVAGDHPIAAGTWARRHFEALQAHRAAIARWQAAATRAAALRFAQR